MTMNLKCGSTIEVVFSDYFLVRRGPLLSSSVSNWLLQEAHDD